MQLLTHIYRKLEDLQRQLWFRWLCTFIVLAGAGTLFGSLIAVSHSLENQRHALTQALTNQNFQRGDEHAVTLRTQGTVQLGGRTYGGPEYLRPRVPLFDEQGNLVQVGAVVESFLLDVQPEWAPVWLVTNPMQTWIYASVFIAWLMLIIWTQSLLPMMVTFVLTAIPVLACYWLDKPDLLIGCAGIGLLTFTFLLLTRVVMLALNQSRQIPAVAHTVLKEASRRGIALVFIVLLLAILPLLPSLLDSGQPLRFRVQSFMSWSLGLTFSIAAVMTLFFSCASVAFEIRDRQIWQLMTKPLARVNYLIGKWVGVMALNLILLIVAGISTFTFVQFLRHSPVDTSTEAGQLDVIAVEDEVLTARLSGRPFYEPLSDEQVRLRVNQIISEDPEMSLMERVPTAQRNAIEKQLQASHLAGLRSVPVNGAKSYVFDGLREAKALGSNLTLRYKFYILRDDEHETFDAGFVFNDDPATQYRSTFVPTVFHALPIPASYIRDDGTLKVSIYNLTPPVQGRGGAINFEEANFELLYKASTFESNFIKAMLTIWVKLAFLGALGICCATFLSFPVACLLSFTVFMGGMLGPFLAESLEWYYPMETHEVDWSNVGMVIQWAFDSVTRQIALGIVFLLSSFGEYKPTQSLVEGRLIPWRDVAEGFVKLAALWSGMAMIIGYLVLRNRQLAIYSGQG